MDLDTLYAKLNANNGELFWSGRVDVGTTKEGHVETSVLEGYERNCATVMAAEGFVEVSSYGLDLGDDDCPKPCTITTWTKK